MQNLQFFHFNNLAFRYRVFDRADEVTPIMAGHFHRAVDLSLFEVDWCDPFATCEKRLFGMIGFSGEVLETGEHFVDAVGVAWPTETLVVIENPNDKTAPCVLVSVDYKRS